MLQKQIRSVNELNKITANNLKTTDNSISLNSKSFQVVPKQIKLAQSSTDMTIDKDCVSVVSKNLINEWKVDQEDISNSFSMSRAFSDIESEFQMGTPSEMFVQHGTSVTQPTQKQGKPFFIPAKNPVLERAQQRGGNQQDDEQEESVLGKPHDPTSTKQL